PGVWAGLASGRDAPAQDRGDRIGRHARLRGLSNPQQVRDRVWTRLRPAGAKSPRDLHPEIGERWRGLKRLRVYSVPPVGRSLSRGWMVGERGGSKWAATSNR